MVLRSGSGHVRRVPGGCGDGRDEHRINKLLEEGREGGVKGLGDHQQLLIYPVLWGYKWKQLVRFGQGGLGVLLY